MLGNILLENLELRKKNCPTIKSQSTYFVLVQVNFPIFCVKLMQPKYFDSFSC